MLQWLWLMRCYRRSAGYEKSGKPRCSRFVEYSGSPPHNPHALLWLSQQQTDRLHLWRRKMENGEIFARLSLYHKCIIPCLTASAAFLKWASKGFSFPLYWPEESWGEKFFYPPPRNIYKNSTLSSPKRSISAILRILVGVGVSSVGKLSAIAGGVFGFLFLNEAHVNKNVWRRWYVLS